MNALHHRMSKVFGQLRKIDKASSFTQLLTGALLILLGLLLRLPGYDGRAFWIDELWRVNLILDPHFWEGYLSSPSVYTAITAPMYALVNQGIATFYVSPWTMRLSSLLPGLLSIGMIFILTIKASRSLLLAVMAGLLVAINGDLIEYSNQLKPYMFEVMVHLICLWIWYELIKTEKPRRRLQLMFFSVLVLALLSAANIIFILPAVAMTIVLRAAWTKSWQDVIVYLIGIFVLAVVVGVMYKYVWSYGSDKELKTYWASGFWSREKETYVHFLANAFGGMWKASFMGFGHHSAIAKSAGILFLLTLTLALFKKAFKDQRLLILIVSYAAIFLLTLILINGIGLWPIGHLRPNLFMDAQFIGVFILVVSCLTSEHVRNMFAVLIILMAVVRIGQVHVNDLVNLSAPQEESHIVFSDFKRGGRVGQSIEEECEQHKNVWILLNPAASLAYNYYAVLDSEKESFNNEIPRCVQFKQIVDVYSSPEKVSATINELYLITNSFWIVYGHSNNNETNVLINLASKGATLDSTMHYAFAGYFKVIRKSVKDIK